MSEILTITAEMEKKIEKLWGKSLAECTEQDACEIVEHYTDETTENAYFMTEDEIWYTPNEEKEDDDEVAPAWTEKYLNTLGMSKADF